MEKIIKYNVYQYTIVFVLLTLAAMLYNTFNELDTVCYFVQNFGIPCPLCGGTRAVRCLLKLDLAGCLTYNPYAIVFVAYVVLSVVLLLLKKRKVFRVCSVVNIIIMLTIYCIRFEYLCENII